jgi:sterol desaturase/sphingolipid hydroxylase (fatty acid hydroxylase superfamily)
MDSLRHTIEAIAPKVLARLLDPFLQVFYSDSLIYWPFLVCTLLVGVFGFWLSHGRTAAALIEFRLRYLSRAIWGHPSAQVDYAYLIVNGVLYPTVVGPLILSGAAIAGAIHGGLDRAFGPMSAPLLDGWSARLIYTVAFFIAYDFGRFVAHSLLHDVAMLWELHKVHHSAEVLTPLTSYRVHPVDALLMQVCPNIATGIVTGVTWYLCAGQVGFYTFLGLHAGIAAFNAIGNLRHTHVWISWGPALNRWFISPAHHQIHHSLEARHLGANRGFELAIWDRLWGTLYVPDREEQFRMGLGDASDGAWTSVGRLYAWPIRYILARIGWARPPHLDVPAAQS